MARWYGPHAVWPLVPLVPLFAALAALRRLAFRLGWLKRQHLPVPVLVVGNLVAGGAGKTPTVAAIVQGLRDRGWRPGVLTRGYGGQSRTALCVTPQTPPGLAGDEAVQLAQTLAVPVAVGRRRVEAGRLLLAHHPELDCLVLDDGLQHLALARDVEVVVVDAARGLGNGWLLPAGPLRERAWRLQGVSAIVVQPAPPGMTAAPAPAWPDAVPRAELSTRQDVPMRLHDGVREPWPAWQGVAVHAVAGIGHPQRFFAQLAARGLAVTGHPFPDHHAYTEQDLQLPGDGPILMTSKDAVKCAAFGSTRLWQVPLLAELPPAVLDHLSALLESARGRKIA